MTASGHASDSGVCATASGHADLPSGQGKNAYADDATGSGQQTTTGHATSGHGVPGIDPRIETGHSETESPHAASGSGQKTATAPVASGHEKRAKRTTTEVDTLDLLTTNGKRSESDNHRDIHELLPRDLALLSSHVPRSEEREPREDNTRWQDYEVSLEFSRRGTCGENWGRQRSRKRGKKKPTASGQPPPRPLPKEKEKRERARAPQTIAQRHRHPSRSTEIEREGRKPPRQNTRCTLRPLPLPLPS